MSFSVCRAWSSLFLSALERQAAASHQYLPPGHTCDIDYPTKLKPNGMRSHVYSRLHTSADAGPFYTVDVAIVGCYGDGKFIETTFVIPSLKPQASLKEYSAEYDTSLEVYIVKRAPESPSTTDVQTDTENQTDVDDWFDAEYIDLEDGDDWESHGDKSGISLGVFRAEDFPVMSPKCGDVKNQQFVEAPSPARSLESSSSESLDSNGKPTATQTAVFPEEESLAEILKPESFDWADEVDGEEEVFNSQPADRPIQSQENQSLKYESFNWADEFDEEEISPGPVQNQETDMLKYESFDWAAEVEDEEVKSSGSMELPAGAQCLNLLEYESFDWSEESDSEELTAAAGTNDNQVVVYSQLTTLPGPFVVSSPPSQPRSLSPFESCEQQETGPFPLYTDGLNDIDERMAEYNEDSQAISELAMQARALHDYNVNNAELEHNSQQGQSLAGAPYMHHVNWLGYGVAEPSGTQAEVSLMVILSGTKMWLCRNPMSREAVTLSQAFRYVDPVLYEGDMQALSLKGTELQRAVTGATTKLYTSHGTWSNDSYGGDEERPILDPMDVDFYESQPCAFMNGWLCQHYAPTREAELCKFRNYVGRTAWDFAGRRHQQYRVSRLRSSLTADEDEEPSSQCARSVRVVRGSTQYWTHEEGQKASEAPPELKAVEGEDVDKPEEGTSSQPEQDIPNDESDQSLSRRDSSATSDPAPSESTEATSTSSTDDEFLSPSAPLPASQDMAVHTIRRRHSSGDLRSAAVAEARQAFTQIEGARMSSPSLVLPPQVIPRIRPHFPNKNPAASVPAAIEPLPPRNKTPKAKYVRLGVKSAPAQAIVSVDKAVPELSMPSRESRLIGGKGKEVWKRVWRGLKLKFSKQKRGIPPPLPPSTPLIDTVHFLQLYAGR